MDEHEIMDYFEMEIPREDFIEEIALDPRLTQEEYQDFAKEIKFHVPNREERVSRLYGRNRDI